MNGRQESPTLGDAQNVSPIISTEKRKNDIPYGYCHCGCGGTTPVSIQNHSKYGWVKGEPKRFIFGHANKKNRIVLKDGYIIERNPTHPRSEKNGYVKTHIISAERAMGKPLPANAVIHHPFGKKLNNTKLVICEDQKYHLLLHLREKAYMASGHASWRKCWVCKKYDSPSNLYIKGSHTHHRECHSEYYKIRRKECKSSRKNQMR
uniref:Putative HNH endonuclease n=1 Tax=viral metagenome TaxID=1070528 RepID=A0A6H1ZFS4_9ZZZZ